MQWPLAIIAEAIAKSDLSGQGIKAIGITGSTGTILPQTLKGSDVSYLPFPGRIYDHPVKLAGTPDEIEQQCRAFMEMGCEGCD